MNSLNILHWPHETKYKQTLETNPFMWIWNLNNTAEEKKPTLDRSCSEYFRNACKAVQEAKIYKHTDYKWTFLQINDELTCSTGFQHLH